MNNFIYNFKTLLSKFRKQFSSEILFALTMYFCAVDSKVADVESSRKLSNVQFKATGIKHKHS